MAKHESNEHKWDCLHCDLDVMLQLVTTSSRGLCLSNHALICHTSQLKRNWMSNMRWHAYVVLLHRITMVVIVELAWFSFTPDCSMSWLCFQFVFGHQGLRKYPYKTFVKKIVNVLRKSSKFLWYFGQFSHSKHEALRGILRSSIMDSLGVKSY